MNHKYFSITELCHSDTAVAKRIANVADVATEERLSALIINVLDPLRTAYGKAISVTSGYRCKRLNQVMGGVKNSQHVSGNAADITAGSKGANRELAKLVVKLKLPFDQMIDERDFQWLHISYVTDKPNRMEILRYNGVSYKKITESDL